MGADAQGVTHARIIIQVKDGKYKITVNDINFDYYNPAGSDFTYAEAIEKSEKGMGKKSFQDYVYKIDKEVPQVIESFEKDILTIDTF